MHLAAAGLILVLAGAAALPASEPPSSVQVETSVLGVQEPVAHPPERLTYTFSWGRFVKVGEVEVTAGERSEPRRGSEGAAGTGGPDCDAPGEAGPEVAGRRSIQVSVRAETSRMIDLMWRYRMNAEGVVHLDPFRPGYLEVRESIKRGPKTLRVEFDGEGRVQTSRNKKGILREHRFEAPNTFDLAAAVLLILNQDLAVGRRYAVDALAGNSRYLITVEVVGEETISAAGGEHAAFKLRLLSRDLTDPPDTEKHDHTDLWVSAARPRRLLQAVSDLWVGAVRGRLVRIEPAAGWPQPPAEIDLGLDRRWLVETEPRVPEIRQAPQGPEDDRARPMRPR